MKIIKLIASKYKNTTLSNKLIIAMSVAFFVLFGLVISFSQYRTVNIITRNQSELSGEILDMKLQNFIKYYNEMESYTLSLRNDSNFMQILRLGDFEDYSNYLYVENAFKNMFYSKRDISELKLYLVNQGINYSISRQYPNVRSSVNPDFTKLDEFVKASKMPDFKYVMPSKDGKHNLLKIYRTIINIEDQRPLAYIEATIDNSYIDELAMTHSSSQDIICLLDKSDNFYYTNNTSVIESGALTDLLPSKMNLKDGQMSGNFIASLNGIKYLFVYSKDNANSWLLLGMTPTSVFNKSVIETTNITITISIISLSIALLAIFMLITTLLKPLKTLAVQMDKAGGGDFGAKVDVNGSAEIKHLEAKFNSMLSKIDDLIKKNYVSELREKTARLKALEAQINPHFLYNTLQMISTQAIINNQKDINNMVQALASIFRYSITDDDVVPLDSEIKHVKAYLTLQKARFDERLSYSLNIEHNTEGLLLPKVSIMCLVENSIKHGMEATLDKIQIDVNVVLSEGYLVITVKDSGVGIPEEKLKVLKDLINNEGFGSQSIGLSNLAGRLHILYGNSASLNIESSEDRGTSVEMRIPVNTGSDTKNLQMR